MYRLAGYAEYQERKLKLGHPKAKPTREQLIIEYFGNFDTLGRITYCLRWIADYHPGHPEGEHREVY